MHCNQQELSEYSLPLDLRNLHAECQNVAPYSKGLWEKVNNELRFSNGEIDIHICIHLGLI